MPTDPVPLAAHLGAGVRRHREAAGLTRQELADRAAAQGLRWSHQTVNAIERGARRLDGEELLLLPWLLGCTPADLLDAEATIGLAGGHVLDGAAAGAIWRGQLPGTAPPGSGSPGTGTGTGRHAGIGAGQQGRRELRRLVARVRDGGLAAEVARADRVHPGATVHDVGAADAAALREAEQKAARALGVDATTLALAAAGLWGRSLTDEREARLAGSVAADASTRTRQAVRGHITRRLLAELRDRLDTTVASDPTVHGA